MAWAQLETSLNTLLKLHEKAYPARMQLRQKATTLIIASTVAQINIDVSQFFQRYDNEGIFVTCFEAVLHVQTKFKAWYTFEQKTYVINKNRLINQSHQQDNKPPHSPALLDAHPVLLHSQYFPL